MTAPAAATTVKTRSVRTEALIGFRPSAVTDLDIPPSRCSGTGYGDGARRRWAGGPLSPPVLDGTAIRSGQPRIPPPDPAHGFGGAECNDGDQRGLGDRRRQDRRGEQGRCRADEPGKRDRGVIPLR